MIFLVTGASGQLGKSFINFFKKNKISYIGFTRNELDITDFSHMESVLNAINFDVLINAAAYTKVDLAEDEPDIADAINHLAPGNLAHMCKKLNKLMVHFSTDYVFDGKSSTPYQPGHLTSPINVYGKSKLLGELEISASGCRHIIFRTSWVFSEHPGNFLTTILRIANKQEALDVVTDQIGSPTYATHIVETVYALLNKDSDLKQSIFHLGGYPEASWYEFAEEILSCASQEQLLKDAPILNPVTAQHFHHVASRPNYSILDSSDLDKHLGREKNLWKFGVRAAIQSIIHS